MELKVALGHTCAAVGTTAQSQIRTIVVFTLQCPETVVVRVTVPLVSKAGVMRFATSPTGARIFTPSAVSPGVWRACSIFI